MGYFSNGTEGINYQIKYCDSCIHNENCAVWDAHLDFNYDECNNDNSILDMLIPRTENRLGNEQCRMYKKAPANTDNFKGNGAIKCPKHGGYGFTSDCVECAKED